MGSQEEFNLENEEEVYREFIDDFERFTSGKQKRNRQFQHASEKKIQNLNNKNKQQQDDENYESNFNFKTDQEQNLIAKRFRTIFLDNNYNNMDSYEKITIFLQKVHSRLKSFKTNEWIDFTILNLFSEIGLILKFLKQNQHHDISLQKQIRKCMMELEKISKSIKNEDKQEEFLKIINLKV